MGWLRRSKSGRGTSQPSSPGDGSARLSVVYGDDSRFDEEEGEFDVYYDACEAQLHPWASENGGLSCPPDILAQQRKSYLEKLTDVWVHTKYLQQAAETEDPVEQMRLIVAWFISGMQFVFLESEFILPSDVRYREDLLFVGQGNLDDAQKAKHRLEKLQRHDKKLRKAHASD
eukprot:jgi/Pico_ML_1/53124/g3730.t1